MPRTFTEHAEINRFLGSHGFPPLESGAGLLQALAFMVRDHEHLRSLIARCAPEDRPSMYDSMKPYLRFEAHPLDWYVAESAAMAAQKQLPELQPGGDFKWPSDARATGLCVCQERTGIYFADDFTPMCKLCRRPVPNPEQAVAQDAVNWASAKKQLTVTCVKCTKQEIFTGDTKADCIFNARRHGWATWEHEGQRRDICPGCPAIRAGKLTING